MTNIFKDYILLSHGNFTNEQLDDPLNNPIEHVYITDNGEESGTPVNDVVFLSTRLGDYGNVSQKIFLSLLSSRFPRLYNYLKIGIIFSWDCVRKTPIRRSELYRKLTDIIFLKNKELIPNIDIFQNLSDIVIILLLDNDKFMLPLETQEGIMFYRNMINDFKQKWNNDPTPGFNSIQEYFNNIYVSYDNTYSSTKYTTPLCEDVLNLSVSAADSSDYIRKEYVNGNMTFFSGSLINIYKLIGLDNFRSIYEINQMSNDVNAYLHYYLQCQIASCCGMYVSLSKNLLDIILINEDDKEFYSDRIPNLNLNFFVHGHDLDKDVAHLVDGLYPGGIFDIETSGQVYSLKSTFRKIDSDKIEIGFDESGNKIEEEFSKLFGDNKLIPKNQENMGKVLNLIDRIFTRDYDGDTPLTNSINDKLKDDLKNTFIQRQKHLANIQSTSMKITLKHLWVNYLVQIHNEYNMHYRNSISTFFAIFCRTFTSFQSLQEFDKLPTEKLQDGNDYILKSQLKMLSDKYVSIEQSLLSQMVNFRSPKIRFNERLKREIINYFSYQDTTLISVDNALELNPYIQEELKISIAGCFPELFNDVVPPNLQSLISQDPNNKIFYLVNKSNNEQILGFISLQNGGIPFESFKPHSVYSQTEQRFIPLSPEQYQLSMQTLPNTISIWNVCTTTIGKLYNNVCKTMISKLLEIIEKTSPDSPIQLVVKKDNIAAIKCYESFNFRVNNVNTFQNPLYPIYINPGLDIPFYRMDRINSKRNQLEYTSDSSISIFFKEYLQTIQTTNLFKTFEQKCTLPNFDMDITAEL